MAFVIGLLSSLSATLLGLGVALSSGPWFAVGAIVLILAILSVRRADKHPDLIPPG